MSPRPETPRGTYGEVWVSNNGAPYKARVRYKDRDGVMRTVARFGPTKRAAKEALTVALRDRKLSSGEMSGQIKVSELAARWLVNVATSNRATQTKQHYAYAVDRYVNPNLGALRVAEADSGLCDEALKKITAKNGPGAARTARAVLNGMFGVAVRYGAITVNPVRETESISSPRRLPRSLPWADATSLVDRLAVDERARMWDLGDLTDWMLATGCRIGEALALRDGAVNEDGEPILDFAGGTWEVNATMIRVKGIGTVIQERPKSEASWRRIAIPGSAMDMVRRRFDDRRLRPAEVQVMGTDEKIRTVKGLSIVFPAPKAAALRDPSNTQSDLREVLDGLDCEACQGTGYELDEAGAFVTTGKRWRRVRCRQGPWSWVSSHTLRKTVATHLKEMGWTPEQVADHLGHAESSMTQNVYFGRRVVNIAAAQDLDRPHQNRT